jgi:glycosyltransferase involved in cell wall biosynthesis
MKVLALASYPVESAATRYRVMQFVDPLRAAGIEVDVSPFLSSEAFKGFYSGGSGRFSNVASGIARRVGEVFTAGRYDALFVQREAMFFGPAVFEWLLTEVRGLPMILDLDDATYIPYTSPTFGRLGSALKCFGKTDRLIERADSVVCGNRFIAEYAASKGARTLTLPTTVDPDIFKPSVKRNSIPVLGWIGTHSTFPLLESIFDVLSKLTSKHEFTLRIIGSGRSDLSVPNVTVENIPWALESEPMEFASFDIGLYPIVTSSSASDEWLKGKSGFKAIQYLASGIPFVMTPVGVCAEIGTPGVTHVNATTDDQWFEALDGLLADAARRQSMGQSGREEFLRRFDPRRNIEELVGIFGRIGRG